MKIIIESLKKSIIEDVRRVMERNPQGLEKDIICTYYLSLLNYMATILPENMIDNIATIYTNVALTSPRTVKRIDEMKEEVKKLFDEIVAGISDAIREVSAVVRQLCPADVPTDVRDVQGDKHTDNEDR